jgi:hypothetical protein
MTNSSVKMPMSSKIVSLSRLGTSVIWTSAIVNFASRLWRGRYSEAHSGGRQLIFKIVSGWD